MVDSLNAEISLGTIANVPEAIQWLGYTYLFGECYHSYLTTRLPCLTVRMRREPFVYGNDGSIFGGPS